MKREEKNQQSRQKIIEGALKEFGEKSYSEASLNAICSLNGISKGIIYHYFKDKDELYLMCVKDCFDKLTETLEKANLSFEEGVEKSLQKYFEVRMEFFNNNSIYLKLFYDTVTNPPIHLREEIRNIKASINQFNITYYEKLLDSLKLRKNISKEEAMEYFLFIQDSFNYYFHKNISQGNDLMELVKEHEAKIRRILNVMLYGIIREE